MYFRARPNPIITNSQKTIKPTTPKSITEIISDEIKIYVISETGKLVKPHSPIGPPPPLPICKKPKNILL